MNRTIAAEFTEHANQRPDALAVVSDGVGCTYGELGNRSDLIASALIRAGVRCDDRVCLLLFPSADAIASIFGIWKSSAVYVPLDPNTPPGRLTSVLGNCAPCWLVTQAAFATRVDECCRNLDGTALPKTIWLDSVPPDRQPGTACLGPVAGDTAPSVGVTERRDDDIAFIIFTSGSTGEPKGVPIAHADLARLFTWVRHKCALGPGDRLSCNAPLNFDSSLWDICGALTSGAELHIVPRYAQLLPTRLVRFIRDSRLTQWSSVPSVLTAMADRGGVTHGDFPALRRLIWYGEALPPTYLTYWMERLPHVEFTNYYGPTEVTLVSTCYTVPALPGTDMSAIPIGTAVPGRVLMIVGEDQSPVETDAVGELWIGGTGLSPGYWRDPVNTACGFIDLPDGVKGRWYRTGDLARRDAAGIYHFHGRRDRQIKLRGYRIELDEIALALSRLTGVADCAVVTVPGRSYGGTTVCAAYTLSPGVTISPAALREQLAEVLPRYMLPSRWEELERIPRSHNGKTDYAALQRRFENQE